MKKILGFLIAVLMMSGVVISSGVVSQPAMAAEPCDNQKTFLMFRAWYYGLKLDSNCSPVVEDTSSEDGLTEFIWKIILNVVYDLFAVIGVIATGFVIYGGYMFILAGGDPGKVAKAKKILTSAIIGILVAISATVIVNTITSFIWV